MGWFLRVHSKSSSGNIFFWSYKEVLNISRPCAHQPLKNDLVHHCRLILFMDNKGTSGVPKPSPITTLDAQQAEAKCSSCKNHMRQRDGTNPKHWRLKLLSVDGSQSGAKWTTNLVIVDCKFYSSLFQLYSYKFVDRSCNLMVLDEWSSWHFAHVKGA